MCDVCAKHQRLSCLRFLAIDGVCLQRCSCFSQEVPQDHIANLEIIGITLKHPLYNHIGAVRYRLTAKVLFITNLVMYI